MEYLKIIKELESTLNIQFEKTTVSRIKWSFDKSAKYSLNRTKEINGICINKFQLEIIPEILLEIKSLTHLLLPDNEISDLSPLTKLKNLVFIDFSSNQITDIENISNLSKLKHLNLKKNSIENISNLKSLINLTCLNLSENKIENIDSLKSLKKLQELCLSDNKIENNSFKRFKKIKQS